MNSCLVMLTRAYIANLVVDYTLYTYMYCTCLVGWSEKKDIPRSCVYNILKIGSLSDQKNDTSFPFERRSFKSWTNMFLDYMYLLQFDILIKSQVSILFKMLWGKEMNDTKS